jgi:hypothetical protein
MAVHIDHPRPPPSHSPQRHLQNMLDSHRIPLRREHEINGFTAGVDRPI